MVGRYGDDSVALLFTAVTENYTRSFKAGDPKRGNWMNGRDESEQVGKDQECGCKSELDHGGENLRNTGKTAGALRRGERLLNGAMQCRLNSISSGMPELTQTSSTSGNVVALCCCACREPLGIDGLHSKTCVRIERYLSRDCVSEVVRRRYLSRAIKLISAFRASPKHQD